MKKLLGIAVDLVLMAVVCVLMWAAVQMTFAMPWLCFFVLLWLAVVQYAIGRSCWNALRDVALAYTVHRTRN